MLKTPFKTFSDEMFQNVKLLYVMLWFCAANAFVEMLMPYRIQQKLALLPFWLHQLSLDVTHVHQ